MCGFAGMFEGSWREADAGPLLGAMAKALAHRGPDDEGLWWDSQARIGLAHRRLSVVDLSSAGHQPMASFGGRYVIAYNGEIYNHLELRRSLPVGLRWRGHSDTETLLACFEAWGLRATLERCIGMFAFALWDREERTLTLARDRLGEKPLYYGWQGAAGERTLLFGSELKALRAHPAFAGDVNRDALCLLLRHANVPAPHSIYRGVNKLEPGCLIRFAAGQPTPMATRYWSATQVALEGVSQPFQGSPIEAVDALEVLLTDAVGRQMVADVPLGAFLSGGVDSSTVAALMQKQASAPVKTFSIGFHEAGYDEAGHARAVARHLGTDHSELYLTAAQAMAVIPQLPALYDEPFADSSQIPVFLVSQLARRHVTVSLSGDGGDELFAGYNRYQWTEGLWRHLSRMPRSLRQGAAWLITRLPPETWTRWAAATPLANRWSGIGEKLHKGATVMSAGSAAELYSGLVSQWNRPEQVVQGAHEPPTPLTAHTQNLSDLGASESMMLLDLMTYLPDDILTKLDRAAMAVGLETRVPFLDHRVVQFAWRLPMRYKLRPEGRGHATKWALRQVLHRHVPSHLVERPKAGFGVPLERWLRGPLRDWAEALLSEARLKREGFFNPAPIREKWAEHLSGRRNWQHPLWCVLMFQAWNEAGRK
jgi:asparagine synthase (glutamine-hydrolysing)